MFTFPNGEGGGLQKVEQVHAGDSPVLKTEIATMGWFAHLRDQDNNLFGIFQPLPREK